MGTDQEGIYPLMKDRRGEKEIGSLAEALTLRPREMISLVGAGGKTTLMFRLAEELSRGGRKVVTTTTTKILEPSREETPCLFIHPDERELRQFLRRHLERYRHITLARERLESGKLGGLSASLLVNLWDSERIDYLIIEADGASGRPIKAPREGEPVIPLKTTLVVAILGVDGLGKELDGENVFRSERFSQLTGLPLGCRVTEEAIVLLMIHPEGLFKGAPASSRVVAFLNKVDLPKGLEKAKEIAEKIVERRHRQIERVVLGQLKAEVPVAEVIFRLDSRRT